MIGGHVDERHRRIAKSTLLIGNCPDDIADEILSRGSVRAYDRGTMIFSAGMPADHLFIVLSGWVKLFRVTASGTEAVVGVFTKGQSIADAVALRKEPYPVNAEAVTQCELMQISAAHLLEIMLKRPEVCLAVLSSTLFHLRGLVAQVETLKARTGAQRAAQFLVSQLPAGQTGACKIELPHDKALIAGRIGMTPESLSRAFARLREHGVDISGTSVQIADVERLARFGEAEETDRL